MAEPTKRMYEAMEWLESTVKKHPNGVLRDRMEYIIMKKQHVLPTGVIKLCLKSGLMREEYRDDGETVWLVWNRNNDKKDEEDENNDRTGQEEV